MTMLRNYLISSVRNLLRQKTSTLLNLAGLTLGISCSIILVLLIDHHASFDQYHSKKDRIYRVVTQGEDNGQASFHAGVPAPLRDAFEAEFPEAETVIFTSYRANALMLVPQRNGHPEKYMEEAGVAFSEPGFFNIFDRNVISGEGPGGLDEPNEAVISARLATKYFGSTDVLGKVVELGDKTYQISGVMEDAPANTDLPFDLILSYATIREQNTGNGWRSIWSDEHCYFLLKEGEQIEKLHARLEPFTRKYLGDDYKGQFLIHPLTDFHYDTRFETYTYQTIPKTMLYVLGAIAAILILTACINFINLSTADAIKRSKEVGVRKTMGSTRIQLIVQFLGETTLITFLALLCSVALVQLALGFINPFLELNLSLDFSPGSTLVLFLSGILVIVSLFSGFYPAIVISSYSPALALKNKVSNKASGGYFLRGSLVVFQFFISQFFIIGTIVLIQQTDFFLNKDLGFAKESVLMLPMPATSDNHGELSAQRRTLKQYVLSITGVEAVTLASAAPFSGEVNKTGFFIQDNPAEYTTQYKQVDSDYIDVFEMSIIAGRNLQDSDTLNAVLANESFARLAGFQNPADLVGKMVKLSGRDYPVIGILKDFNTASLERPIEPTLLFNGLRRYKTMAVRINSTRVPDVIAAVKEAWEKTYPDQLFEYSFLDENIRNFYRDQRKMVQLLTTFTVIAICIGCLGLFGLVSFMTNAKTKEIGVRKVLGASVEHIMITFSWGYVRFIFLGFLLAFPLGWLVMDLFLDEFAYKISLHPMIFISAFLITLAIALITVGFKSFRAAAANPVNSLRYE